MGHSVRWVDYKNVTINGTLPTGGVINVEPGTTYSAPEGGCGNPGCNCSPGHWVCRSLGRTTDGEVRVYNITFDTREELESHDLVSLDQLAMRAFKLRPVAHTRSDGE